MSGRCISLQKYRGDGSKIYSGRDAGIKVREILKIDDLDHIDTVVTFLIPKDTWAINSSFFGGLFEKSVQELGRDKFLEHYSFRYDDQSALSEALGENIQDGIFDALNDI